MRAAKAAKDVQSASNELAERLCSLVTEEVKGFKDGLGSQLAAESQQSVSEYLEKALPLISQVLRVICCDQPDDPSTGLLMHLAGQACAPSLLSQIRAAFPKVPRPPGKPGESPRRHTMGARARLSMSVEVEEIEAGMASASPTLGEESVVSSPSLIATTRRKTRRTLTSDSTIASQVNTLSVEETVEYLRKVSRLNEYDTTDLQRVADVCEIRSFDQAEAIISTGAPADALHFLLQGTADLCEHKAVQTLRPGDFLGVEAIQQGKSATLKNPTSLVALSHVKTLCVPRDKFKELDLIMRKSLKRDGFKAGGKLAGASRDREGDEDGHCAVTGLKLAEVETSDDDRQMMVRALKENKVLSEVLGLTTEQCERTLENMHMVMVPKDAQVFKKGDIGNALFIVHSGMLKVDLGSTEVMLRLGDVFGELSLLYDEPRSATIYATRDCRLWVLPRHAFKEVMQESQQLKMEEYSRLLHNVPSIQEKIDLSLMPVLAGAVEEIVLYEQEVVCVQGEDVGKLFLLQSGACSVVECRDNEGQTDLVKGDWVGEKQLIENVAATRTVRVISEKAHFLMVDNYHFALAVNASQDASFIQQAKRMSTKPQELSAWLRRKSTLSRRAYTSSRVESVKDFEIVGALGEGSFGQVLLVKDKAETEYALKRVSRKHLEEEKQENMVRNERGVMVHCDSPFIIRLHGAFQDRHAVYFLLEAALGGELFDIYTEEDFWGQADKARFYVACVALGLTHLHEKHVIWRDLKLENCLVDKQGFVKITDFGISKMVTGKTYTVCGTADYFAPETLKQVGHNRAADWWALGIMLFIMIAGYSPFDAPEVTQIYKNIIKGLSKLQFPAVFTPEAEECVRALCRKKPEDRIVMQRGGLNNLAEMAFFENLDWKELAELNCSTPYQPSGVDYAKIADRKLSSSFEICWSDLRTWTLEGEEERPRFTASSSYQMLEEDDDV